MDPAKVAFRWFQERFGREQLIETTIWDLWSEGSRWYVTARSRTRSNPRSADNLYETLEIDGATGAVVPRQGRCHCHGSLLRYDSRDLLVLQYTTIACNWCFVNDQKYQEFRWDFDEAASLLQDDDRGKRVDGAYMIVDLVEEGTRVIGPTTSTRFRGRPYGCCPNDGTPLRIVSDNLLMFRYTAFRCRWDLWREPKYRDFNGRFDRAARLLQDKDHRKRLESTSVIVQLVEEGAGVIGPSPRTEWQGRAHYDPV